MTPQSTTFEALLQRLWKAKHTGPVTLHFHQGRPSSVDIPVEKESLRLRALPVDRYQRTPENLHR